MDRYAIEISNLNVYYGKVCALSDINMKVREGDFVGIIGPNGGGKSTLLKAIQDLYRGVGQHKSIRKISGTPIPYWVMSQLQPLTGFR